MTSNTHFIYDAEQLSSLTSEQEYRLGLFYYKENRVFECYQSQNILHASVEGSHSDLPYTLTFSKNQQGSLNVDCDCDADSLTDTGHLCKHAIASLLFHKEEADQESEDNSFLNLQEKAIKDRIKRGQNEVKIEHHDGHPIFGLYKAQSITNKTPWARSYTVHIRSLTERINYCNCPDLLNNQLGTCKHIEATLYFINKNYNAKQIEKNASLSAPLPFIYYRVNINTQEAKISLQRTANMSKELIQLLQSYFDAQGTFTGSLPDDFFALQNKLYGNDQLVIGEDALRYVQQLANKQSHLLKAQNIRKQINQLDGKVAGVNAALYPYQIEGMSFLAANGRALLADDMGLGKTLQAISASAYLINNAEVKRILIVCPASLKQQWAREIEKFTGFASQIITGNAEKRHPQYNQTQSNDAVFVIVNYELLLRDLSVINEVLSPDLIILDEAQRIKNWRTKVATATKLISSRYAFVLTGTPVENKLEELYSLMQVVDPTILGPLWRYMSDFHILDERGKVIGYRNLTELRKKIAPAMLRRDRIIVSDQLPNRVTTQLDVAMTKKQKELHGGGLSIASQLANIAKKRPLTPSEQNRMMAALQQTRMACNAAGLVDKETLGSPKLDELKTLIEELCLGEGQKMVVFSQWKGMTTMIEAMLNEMNIGHVHLHGGIPSHKRGDLIDKFNNDQTIKVFISTDAGGSGLNLQVASVLVNMDLPWNPAVLEQRNARIHRLGQKNKVQIILIIAADSYEQRILQLVNSKQDLFDNVISPEANQDVIGITKKSLSAVLNELNETENTAESAVSENLDNDVLAELSDEDQEPIINVETEPEEYTTTTTDITDKSHNNDDQLAKVLSLLQQSFGKNIEQVLAKNSGLLIIVDRLNQHMEDTVDELNVDLNIAIIDRRTQQQLAKLGADDPIADARIIELVEITEKPSIWQQQAKDKLSSAKFLFEHKQEGVIDLLSTAISACITELAAKSQLINAEDLPVWLFSQGVPKQLITDQQATKMIKIVSLKHAASIPEELIQQALADTELLIVELCK